MKMVKVDPGNSSFGIELSNLSSVHTLGYKNVNWVNTFRNGLAADLTNTLTVSYSSSGTPSFSTQIGTEFYYFKILNNFLNLSGRLIGSWSNDKVEMSNYLRGVRTGYLYGYLGVAASIDITVSLIHWVGVLQIQARPFFDVGIVDKRNQAFDSSNDFAYTTGFDGMLYLDRWKNLVIRGTFGIDLSHFNWNDLNKYEIEMTAGLSY